MPKFRDDDGWDAIEREWRRQADLAKTCSDASIRDTHASLARMLTKVIGGFGPRVQLTLFPASMKPKVKL